jgi:hypothetical protein
VPGEYSVAQYVGTNFWGDLLLLSSIQKGTLVKGPKFSSNEDNSVALVSERTIPIERQPLVGKVSDNFLWIESVSRSA